MEKTNSSMSTVTFGGKNASVSVNMKTKNALLILFGIFLLGMIASSGNKNA